MKSVQIIIIININTKSRITYLHFLIVRFNGLFLMVIELNVCG